VLNKPTGSNKTRNLYVNNEFNLQNWSILNFVKKFLFDNILFKKKEKSLQSQYLQYIIKKRIEIPAQNCEKTNFSHKIMLKTPQNPIGENLNLEKKRILCMTYKNEKESAKNICKMYVIKSELCTKLQIRNVA